MSLFPKRVKIRKLFMIHVNSYYETKRQPSSRGFILQLGADDCLYMCQHNMLESKLLCVLFRPGFSTNKQTTHRNECIERGTSTLIHDHVTNEMHTRSRERGRCVVARQH